MKLIYIISLFILSCTNLFINEEKYNSLAFNGGSWIEFPHIDSMRVRNYSFSLQFWVSGGTTTTNEAPALFSIIDTNDIRLALYRDPNINNSITLDINSQIEKINDLKIDWSKSNQFHLISILFSKTDPTKVFIDSTEVFRTNTNIDIEGSTLMVGALVNESRKILENFWYGYIDEIRLWNMFLHDTTITFHYNNPNKLGNYYRTMYNNFNNDLIYTDDSDSLIYNSIIGLWRLNRDNTNAIIEDDSYYKNHGIIYTLPNFSIELSQLGS